MEELRNQRVIVTGGAGFIGSSLVKRLRDEGHKVMVVDNLSAGSKANVSSGVELLKMCVCTDPKKLEKAFVKFDPHVVFHLAANKDLRKSLSDPLLDARENVIGTLNVLEACKAAKVGRVVFASTAAVYSAKEQLPISEKATTIPSSPYGISKRAAELYMWNYSNLHEMAAISLRFSNAYGPWGSLTSPNAIDIFTRRLLKGDLPVVYGSGEQTRDFIYIDDIIDAFMRAMKVAWCGELNISTNTETTINRIYKYIADELGSDVEPKYEEAKEGELFQSRLDASLAQEVMGWVPRTSIGEGIKKTVAWYKQQHAQNK